MSVNEFLIALYEELKYLPKKKREQIINLYRDKMNLMLDTGEPELKVVSSFKSPKELADQIYNEEGIDYLTRYKKQKKVKDVLTIIISIILSVLLVATAFTLSYLLIYSIIKLTKLVFLLNGWLEIVLMTLLIIGYDITIILVLIYLIDLFILTLNLLIDNIYKAFGKEYKLIEFSITDIFDKIFKKKNITSKILVGFAIGTLVLFVCNFACKTYFYRSFTQTTPDNFVVDYNLEHYKNSDITINIDEANLYIKPGNELKLTVQSEFERNVYFNETETGLQITTDNLQKFDFLNLLEEPLPVFTLYIPLNNSNMNIKLNDGCIYIEDITSNNINLETLYGNIILSNVSNNELKINSLKGGVNLKKCKIIDLNIVADEGQFILSETDLVNLDVSTDNASIDIQKVNASNIKVNTEMASFYIQDINCNALELNINSANGDLKNINSLTDINITAELKSNITLYEASAINFNIITNTGTFTGYFLNGNGNIKTFGNLALKELKGSYEIECFGSFMDLFDSTFEQLKIRTQSTQTMLQFIKADKIIYEGVSSQTVASLVFAKQIKMRDDHGDLNFDYDKSLTDDLDKYNQYYVKLERLEISTNAIYRVENGVEFGEVQ